MRCKILDRCLTSGGIPNKMLSEYGFLDYSRIYYHVVHRIAVSDSACMVAKVSLIKAIAEKSDKTF